MKKIGVSLLLCSSCFALETKPWFGNAFECELTSQYAYSYYPKINRAIPHNHHSNDNVIDVDLGFFTESVHAEVELEAAATTKQSFGYRSFALQGRYQWLDDICGDFMSFVTGVIIRQVSAHRLRDPSTPYHYKWNFSLSNVFGKEWAKGDTWKYRSYAFVNLGIANKGSAWLDFLAKFQWRYNEHHQGDVFAKGYFGFGKKNHVNLHNFFGWNDVAHRSIDLGAEYRYYIRCYGHIFVDLMYRIYAHAYPEKTISAVIGYQLPFCCF